MALTDDDFRLFETDRLSILVPAYLRQQKGVLLFKAPAVGVEGRSLKLVSAIAHDVPDYRRILLDDWASQPRSMNWQGVTQIIERRGPIDWLPNGHEGFIFRASESANVEVAFDYSVIFGDEEHPIEVKVLGHGQRPKFEEICRKIILSVRRK